MGHSLATFRKWVIASRKNAEVGAMQQRMTDKVRLKSQVSLSIEKSYPDCSDTDSRYKKWVKVQVVSGYILLHNQRVSYPNDWTLKLW